MDDGEQERAFISVVVNVAQEIRLGLIAASNLL